MCIYIDILRNFLFFSFALLSLSLSPSLASLFLFVASKFVDDFDVDFCARVCLGNGDYLSLCSESLRGKMYDSFF